MVICVAPSAAVSALDFNGLARTVKAPPLPLSSARPSASLVTVRGGGTAKPLAGLDFGAGADGADDADGRAPVSSGVAWVGVVALWIVRVRARPLRPKLISMPILRRKGAARRSASQIVLTRAPVYKVGSPEQTMPTGIVQFLMLARVNACNTQNENSYEHRISRQRPMRLAVAGSLSGGFVARSPTSLDHI